MSFSAGLLSVAGLLPASPAIAAGLYETRIFVGCNIPDNAASPYFQSYSYSFGGNTGGVTGQMDSYTNIYINDEYQARADETFNVASKTAWTSNTWYGTQPSFSVVRLETKIYKHNGDGTVLGETFSTCGPAAAVKAP